MNGRREAKSASRSTNSNKTTWLKRVADLANWDPSAAGAVSSGLEPLDRILNGGFRPGELTIWSGINSSGKSTFLGQMLLEAIDQDQAVCAYSGELPDHIFRYWLELQAAGPNGLEIQDASDGSPVYSPRVDIVTLLRRWYGNRLYLYDGGEMENITHLLQAFSTAARDYTCRIFLLDNLTMTVSRLNARDQYRAQRELILETVRFARVNAAHVHIVVHPRKNTGAMQLTKADIGGSGDITNLADNVLVLARPGVKEIRKQEFTWDARVTVLKNRFSGRQDVEVHLSFDPVSRRFYPVGSSPEDRQYGWVYLANPKLRGKARKGGKPVEH